jgi:WhiB family transcriptional regulator, redox-sensing transcriptional regulator
MPMLTTDTRTTDQSAGRPTGTARLRVSEVPRSTPVDWAARARCAGADVDADVFFAAEGERGRGRRRREAEALAICARCPVREACLAFAVGTGQPDGIWGGQTERERPAAPAEHAPA